MKLVALILTAGLFFAACSSESNNAAKSPESESSPSETVGLTLEVIQEKESILRGSVQIQSKSDTCQLADEAIKVAAGYKLTESDPAVLEAAERLDDEAVAVRSELGC